eukprot:6956659-Prymnesium_polylepis.1
MTSRQRVPTWVRRRRRRGRLLDDCDRLRAQLRVRRDHASPGGRPHLSLHAVDGPRHGDRDGLGIRHAALARRFHLLPGHCRHGRRQHVLLRLRPAHAAHAARLRCGCVALAHRGLCGGASP